MAAYVILDIEVTDAETYKEYAQLAPATVTQYGGKYLARGGRTQALEGGWLPGRLVVIEFPGIEQARAWVDSPEYSPIKAIRQRASHSRVVVVEGI